MIIIIIIGIRLLSASCCFLWLSFRRYISGSIDRINIGVVLLNNRSSFCDMIVIFSPFIEFAMEMRKIEGETRDACRYSTFFG